MSKKKWLLAIIVSAFIIYLAVSKIDPKAGWGIDKVAGGAIGGVKSSIEASPIWQRFDIWFSAAFFTIVTSLFWWKGRTTYDRVRGIARVRATQPSSYQAAPVIATAPQPIVKAAPAPAPTPQPEPQPTEQKQTA